MREKLAGGGGVSEIVGVPGMPDGTSRYCVPGRVTRTSIASPGLPVKRMTVAPPSELEAVVMLVRVDTNGERKSANCNTSA